MTVYVLFVHYKSVSKRKVCIIFIKIINLEKPEKPPPKRWVFYWQPCLMELGHGRGGGGRGGGGIRGRGGRVEGGEGGTALG
jgi:hypothetical protein